jgi:uncharacterized membrane protein YkoI
MNLLVPLGIVLLALSGPASADKLVCSIKASKGATGLEKMAKLSRTAAEKTALAKAAGTVSKGDLEVEDGCLVYSFDIKVAGKSGAEEIMVDAGNGKIISHKHETAVQEAAEKAMDKLKPKK